MYFCFLYKQSLPFTDQPRSQGSLLLVPRSERETSRKDVARVKRLGTHKFIYSRSCTKYFSENILFRDEIRRVNIADLHDGDGGPFWKQWFKDVAVAIDCIYCRACW